VVVGRAEMTRDNWALPESCQRSRLQTGQPVSGFATSARGDRADQRHRNQRADIAHRDRCGSGGLQQGVRARAGAPPGPDEPATGQAV